MPSEIMTEHKAHEAGSHPPRKIIEIVIVLYMEIIKSIGLFIHSIYFGIIQIVFPQFCISRFTVTFPTTNTI